MGTGNAPAEAISPISSATSIWDKRAVYGRFMSVKYFIYPCFLVVVRYRMNNIAIAVFEKAMPAVTSLVHTSLLHIVAYH